MSNKQYYLSVLFCAFFTFTAQSDGSDEKSEEEYTVLEAVEIYQRSDEERIQDPTYQPEKDEEKQDINLMRRFVINGENEVRYFTLGQMKQPTLLFLNGPDSNRFHLSHSYQKNKQEIIIEPQLNHHVAQHELFSLMPIGKNFILFFQTRYYYTPEERQHNYAFTPLFEPYDTRSSYELIEVDTKGKLVHQTQFIAPSPEDGMSFGSDYINNENQKDHSKLAMIYQTKTPGDYNVIKPYDIEVTYLYQNGKLHKSEEKQYLSPKEYLELKRTKKIKKFTNDDLESYGHEEDLQPTNCLDDYFVYQDKAAPQDVTWGNAWLQQSSNYQKFMNDYQKGKSYTWTTFRKNFCPLTTS